MKIAYFDCFSGISGDMCLGALVDAGVSLDRLSKELKKLPVSGYTLSSRGVSRCGIAATKVEVKIDKTKKEERRLSDIEKIIRTSSLGPGIKEAGLSVFRSLFEAEAKVHGEPVKKIHLHELGAVDCFVDIFGTLIGLEMLGIEAVYASPLNLGSGSVRTSHGILPVPAPATAELVKGMPVYSSGSAFEKTTPTGAAIIRALAAGAGAMPVFIPEKTGIGAGGKDPETEPNVLRLIIGDETHSTRRNSVIIIETNIDDMNPQIYEYVSELLFGAGALDVFLTQLIMKKMRPGVKLSVLSRRQDLDRLIGIILRETTSIGLRYYDASRIVMERRITEVETSVGKARVKAATYGDISRLQPEYEDCKRLAKKSGIPLLSVIEEVRRNAVPEKRRAVRKPGRKVPR